MKFDTYRHTKYIFLTIDKNKDLRVKTKTVKILEDNIGVKPSWPWMWQKKDLKIHQKHKQEKKKIHKLDFAKIKNFCASKDTIKTVKWQSTEWEKMFASYMSDWGLYLEYTKNSYNSIIKRQKTQFKTDKRTK